MTEEKKSKNPFINLANQAKKNASNGIKSKSTIQNAPKVNSKGFGGTSVVRRAGRGG
jgi:hypothetical protein